MTDEPPQSSGPPPSQPTPPPASPSPWAPRRTNGFAIASLVFGILGGVLLSVIFGVVALRRINRTGERGRTMAIVGLSLSALWVVGIGAIAWYAIATQPQRDATGEITQGGGVRPAELRVGDCVNDLREEVVLTVQVTPCEQGHEAQVFDEFNLPDSLDSPYPGDSEVFRAAEDGCVSRASRLTQLTQDPSAELFYFHPTEQSWEEGDRQVLCLAYYGGDTRTGSVLD